MKPRLTRGWMTVWMGTSVPLWGWYCTGNSKAAWHVTPKGAYDKWASEVCAAQYWRRLNEARMYKTAHVPP